MTQSRQGLWYMAGVVSWFVGAGTQGTLYPWMIAVLLGESAFRVGTAQTFAMLPALLLMLLGGAVADRVDCRRLLVRVHLLASLPPLGLAIALVQGHRSYESILGYAVCMGAIAAFGIPARDSLLSTIAMPGTQDGGNGNVQRMVTTAIALQVVSQIVGTIAGGAAAYLGAPWILLFQAAANGVGAIFCLRLKPAPRSEPATTQGRLADIRAGLLELIGTPRLLPITLINVSIGFLFLGAFLVAVPLLVRDVYGGSSAEIAAMNGSMSLGMLAGSGGLLARGGVRRQGRAVILSLAAGGLILITISLGPPLPLVFGLIFLFGVGGGVATPAARTVVQEAARPSHRGRILSAYNFGFMGAAPIGAFAMGALASWLGPLSAIAIPGALMLGVTAAAALASDTWNFEGGDRNATR